jgi:hypothetical protein
MTTASAFGRLSVVLGSPGGLSENRIDGPVIDVPLACVVLAPPERSLRDPDADPQIDDLVDSLRSHGQLHEIGVHQLDDGTYELIYGARRLAAAQQLGWETIRACVRSDVDDLSTGLAENLVRRDLTGKERARVFRLLAEIHRPGKRLGGRGAGTGKIVPPPAQPNSMMGLAKRLGVDTRTVGSWVALGRTPEVLALVENDALDWTRGAELVRAPEEVRPQLIAEVLAAESTPKTRLRTLDIRKRGLALAGKVSRTATLRMLNKVLLLLTDIVTIATPQETQVLEQISAQVRRLRRAAEGAMDDMPAAVEIVCLMCGRLREHSRQPRCIACGGSWTASLR